METARMIMKEGGPLAFFRGNGANVVKVGPEGALKFLIYDRVKALVAVDPSMPSIGERLVSGALAGSMASTIIYPLEIAKTRLAISRPGTYSGIFDCLVKTRAIGGTRALYQGIAPNLLGVIPYASVDLSVFGILKRAYEIEFEDDEPGALPLLVCGGLSSTAGQLVAYPLQLLRTRLQAQGLPGVKVQYSGMFDAARQIYASNGVRGFYRGLAANIAKALPATSISFAVYTITLRHLGSEMH